MAILDSRLPSSVLQLCRQILRPTPRLFRPISTPTSTQAQTLSDFSKTLTDQEAAHLTYTHLFGKNYQLAFDSSLPDDELDALTRRDYESSRPAPPHHLHVYATKHNTHINLTSPDHNPILSKSTGNIGFRKSNRGTYDAAFQLSAYMLGQIYESGLLGKIKRLEIVLRGFGVGREAVTKALLGAEGRRLRPCITQVTDTTRLKFGGTRSKKPRRLG